MNGQEATKITVDEDVMKAVEKLKEEYKLLGGNNLVIKGTLPSNSIIASQNVVDINGLEHFKNSFEKQLLEKLSLHPTFEHKCNNCGGTVKLDIDRHIFICPYCDSVYAIGTQMIKER